IATHDSSDDVRLEGVLPEFEIADEILTVRPLEQTLSRRGAEIAFVLDEAAQVVSMSPLAVSELGLMERSDLGESLGAHGRTVLSEIANGDRLEGLVSARMGPDTKPVLLSMTTSKSGKDRTVKVRALPIAWMTQAHSILMEEFHLSDAEVGIVRQLFDGERPKQIARLRDRSIETVRSQIRSILAKTNARDLSDLRHLCYALIAALEGAGHPPGFASGRQLMCLKDGRTCDVLETGQRDGRPLLLLHGCLGGRVLVPTAQKALAHRRIIAPGRSGHGLSDVSGPLGSDVSGRSRDMIEVIDQLGVGSFDVVAHDTGAATALTLAAMIPERIGKVLIVGALPPLTRLSDLMRLPYQQRVFPMSVRTSRAATMFLARLGGQRLLRDGPGKFAETVFAGVPTDVNACTVNQALQAHYWRAHAWHIEQGPHGFVGEVETAATDWAKNLSDIATELKFFHGANDHSAPLELVRSLAESVSGQLEFVPETGHSLFHATPTAWTVELLNSTE
ncbi:MAG: alpha/beta hydrolase, partial [Pseudomonadota bacterium]